MATVMVKCPNVRVNVKMGDGAAIALFVAAGVVIVATVATVMRDSEVAGRIVAMLGGRRSRPDHLLPE
jgi:hypothetical protein